METVVVELDAKKFDEAVKGPSDMPILPEDGKIHIYLKDGATAGDSGAAVITWIVQLPDESFARVQAVTTCKLLVAVGKAIEGYKAAGRLH